MSTTERVDTAQRQTTVEVRATGHVRTALGEPSFEFTFEGDTLREFLTAIFESHEDAGLNEMLIAATDAEGTAPGWAKVDEVPGSWYKNPEGENTRPYARVLVNGRFNETLDGFDTKLEDGDRVALAKPFMFCC